MRGMRARFRSAATAAGLSLSCLASIASQSLGVALVLALHGSLADARDYVVQQLHIDEPYARPTPPGARTGAAYFTIRNAGTTADRLVRVTTPVAASAELHSMTMDGNLMRMRSVPALDVPPGGTVALAPGGYHLMLDGLAHPLSTGGEVPLTLTFEKAGAVDVVAPVEARDEGASMVRHR
jgi:copper(I)-binding protein